MNKLFGIIALTVVAMLPANAADFGDFKPVTLLSITSHSLTITNGATSNYVVSATTPIRASVRGANTIGIGTKLQLNGAGTDGTIFKFKKSVDGVNFETTPSILITNANAGTTATYYVNSATVSGVAAIELATIINGTAAQAITNAFVKIFPTP